MNAVNDLIPITVFRNIEASLEVAGVIYAVGPASYITIGLRVIPTNVDLVTK